MTSRETILSAVRNALGFPDASPVSVAAEAAALLAHPDAVRPTLLHPEDLLGSFIARLNSGKIAATTEEVTGMGALPTAVVRYLSRHALAPVVTVQPCRELEALTWGASGITRSEEANDGVAVSLARWGIAETGSLVFHSGPDSPTLLNFLPLHHIVCVRAETIVAYLESYWAEFKAWQEDHPRNVNLITGASGTTDIEGALVIGAHGPGHLHVVVARDGS